MFFRLRGLLCSLGSTHGLQNVRFILSKFLLKNTMNGPIRRAMIAVHVEEQSSHRSRQATLPFLIALIVANRER